MKHQTKEQTYILDGNIVGGSYRWNNCLITKKKLIHKVFSKNLLNFGKKLKSVRGINVTEHVQQVSLG